MRSREGKLEDYFKDEVKALGGEKLKWTSPGVSGVTDDIIFYLNKCWIVELKNTDGSLEPSQKRMIPRLSKNYPVYVLYGYEMVDKFINEELIKWLMINLEKTSIVQNALIKECVEKPTKLNLERTGIDVKAVVTELQASFTQNLNFYPPSKQSQLGRRSGSSSRQQ